MDFISAEAAQVASFRQLALPLAGVSPAASCVLGTDAALLAAAERIFPPRMLIVHGKPLLTQAITQAVLDFGSYMQ